MSNDLIARLRDAEPCGVDRCREMSVRAGCVCAEAAEEILRLRAIVARYDAERTQISPEGAARAALKAREKKDD